MPIEATPKPNKSEDEPERESFEEEGRKFSWTPKEREDHEEAERRRRILEGGERIQEKVEEKESMKRELTEKEQQILKELVSDDKTRASLPQEVIDLLIQAKEEEIREAQQENREAA